MPTPWGFPAHHVSEILFPTLSWAEKFLRPLLVYLFLLLALRFTGKRELGQTTLFDLVVVLLLSNVVQNAMIGEDNSLLGGFVGAATLLLAAWIIAKITVKAPKTQPFIEGTPTILLRDGIIDDSKMLQEGVSKNDLLRAIRREGIGQISAVRWAILELDGAISIIAKNTDSSASDDDAVLAEFDDMQRNL